MHKNGLCYCPMCLDVKGERWGKVVVIRKHGKLLQDPVTVTIIYGDKVSQRSFSSLGQARVWYRGLLSPLVRILFWNMEDLPC